jgi:hypothetical protein
MPPNSPYYARFRYKSSTGVFSEYSEIVRSATGSLIQIEYILKSFPGGQFQSKSFDSNPFFVSPKPYLYIVAIDNSAVPLTYQEVSGLDTSGNTPAQGPCKCGLYLQLRQPATFVVTQLGPNNGLADVEGTNVAFGMNDYFANGNFAPVEGGTGTGGSLILERSPTGQTLFKAIGTPGTGYTVGDVLTFTPPIGNGSNAANRVTNVTGFSVGTLDSYWDVLIHGIGQNGGAGEPRTFSSSSGPCAGYLTGPGTAGGNASSQGVNRDGGKGGTPRYQLYPTGGGGYGSGGAGWSNGGGRSGPIGEFRDVYSGAGGGATYINPELVTDPVIAATIYPTPGVIVYVDDVLVGTAEKSLFYYRLA